MIHEDVPSSLAGGYKRESYHVTEIDIYVKKVYSIIKTYVNKSYL